jgi:hypothetical protein
MNIDTLDMDFQDYHLNRSQYTAEGLFSPRKVSFITTRRQRNFHCVYRALVEI